MEAGDWAEIKKFEPWEKTEFLWELMGELGYDALTPGPRELIHGKDALQGLFDTKPEIQVVSANITDKSGALLWDRYIIVEKGGVKFGVTGVTGGAPYSFNLTRGLQTSDDFSFLDSREALREVVPELRSQVDLVVVLLHESPGDARRIVDEIPGMDVVVVGHSPGYMFNPDRIANTLLIRGGNRGQYLPVLDLVLDADNRVVDYNGEGKPLGKPVAKEERIDKVITEFEADRKTREAKAKREEAVGKAMNQGSESFIGADACARCHANEYTGWSGTTHASVERTGVRPEDALAAESLDISNVQCEHCHGLGTFHGTTGMLTVVEEETCRTCHVQEGAPDFDYAQALEKGIH